MSRQQSLSAIAEQVGRFTSVLKCAGALALSLVFGLAAPPLAHAQTFTTLHSFNGADGGDPYGPVLDVAGSLYGTTASGGASIRGTIFRVTSTGQETVLYSFTGQSDGGAPYSGLIRDKQNNGYGTTQGGGTSGFGTIFKISSHGVVSVLHRFTGGLEGGLPTTGLVMDPAGNLYGTTSVGGASAVGNVFKLDTTGNMSVLYSFRGGTDGANPLAGLVRDAAGNLYGTTQQGGASIGFGTVFKIDANGNETILYKFSGGADGSGPVASLLLDAAGNLYGTTEFGGNTSGGCAGPGCGVVFKLDRTGKETVLYAFAGYPNDGSHPVAGLVADSKGNGYGTTLSGGSSARGVVFKLSSSGHETVLHNFGGGADGSAPLASLAIDAQGNLFGTASTGGTGGLGTVFKIAP